MNFKDIVQSDLDNTFFNSNECGETHNINGINMTIVKDDDLLKEQKLKSASGTYKGDILFQVRKSEFGEKPAIYQIIKFDFKPMQVTDCQEDMGVYTITLEANMS